ncbi:histidine kinase dimerization/phospho-acceptor domain-containing protein [Paucidesulfovibrio longus]|uniref:histidine kinase dimerization/phospho-acceptor domain-containing protein n=1 Tax=Paucidesulfovibrio longus TaxID=889 RepID=UPI00048258D8|nr:transporter substrate-binding domain-containing protein [Paucidesulfovibrio longus]
MKKLNILLLLLTLVAAGVLLVIQLYSQEGSELPEYSQEEVAWLKDHAENIEVLFGYQAPPNAFTDDKGRYVGLMVDYFREIERNMGIRIRFRNFKTWSELIEYSKTHSGFIVVGIAETGDRKSYLQFTPPFVRIPYTIVTQDSSEVHGIADLAGKSVCTVRNYAVNDYLRENHPAVRIHEVDDNLEGLRAVATGKSVAMILNQAYASYIIETEGLTGLRIAGASGYMNYLSAACSRSDSVLFGILEKATASIPEARHRELFRRWVYPEAGYVHLSERSVRLLWALAVLVLMGAGGLWLLLRSLRETVRRQTLTIREDYERLKRAETTLRMNQEKLSAALERITFHVHNSPLAVVEWNHRGRVTGWSPQAEAIFGWRLEEVLGRSLEEWRFVHEDDLPRVRAEASDLLSGDKTQTVSEIRNYDKNGEVVYCRWYNSVLRNTDGEVVSILSQVENVTESKLAEQDLIRAKEAAEAANQAKSEFLANMSHEIRTPLNGIQGMLQIMQTTTLDSEQQSFVEKAITSTRRLTRLLSDILDLSSIESGRLELASEPFDPRSVLESVRALFEPSVEDKGLRLTTDCHDSVPPSLLGDATRLRQILLNLVGNAVKFTHQGGVVRVWMRAGTNGRDGEVALLVLVGDDGIGMEEEQVGNLLTTFVPGEVSYQRKYEGAGLGLAVVVRLVRLMDGSLCIASEPGAGTDVGCVLRLRRAA